MVQHIAYFTALLLLMLVTGVFWGPWFALSRSMKVFSAAEFMHIAKTLAENLAKPMRIMLPLTIVFMVIVVWLYPPNNSIGFYLSTVGLILIFIALLVTIIVEVPIVKQIIQWTDATIPGHWPAVRDKWVKFHLIRVLASITSFAAFLASILFKN
ncbi:MAG TPA: DUF1772 domain-containing protein [Mucilaginibacter sp.]